MSLLLLISILVLLFTTGRAVLVALHSSDRRLVLPPLLLSLMLSQQVLLLLSAPEWLPVALVHGVADVVALTISISAFFTVLFLEQRLQERRNTQATLQQHEQELITLTEAIPQQIWTALPDGTIDYVSQRIIDYVGRPLETQIDSGWQEVVHPDDVEQSTLAWQQASETATPLELEARLQRAEDGMYRWHLIRACPLFDDEGNVLKWFGSNTDISDRKEALKALQISEEKYRLLFATSQSAIIIVDLETRQIIDTNEAALKLYGYTREKMLSMDAAQLSANPEGAAQSIAKMVQLAPMQAHADNVTHRHKDGTPIAVDLSAGTFMVAGRKMIYAAFQDVSERHRIELEREHLIAELEAKNSELGRYTYTVSHDLKSPLVTIKGFLGLLEEDLQKGTVTAIERDITFISRAADQMQNLLDDLLALSRVGRIANPPVSISIHEIASEAVSMVVGPIQEHQVTVEIDPDLPVVRVDRPRLVEVFLNLLSNAIKFRADRPDPHIKIGMRQDGTRQVFYVQDNGIGIDPGYHAKVFNLFDRLDAQIEGTGIGLALIKRIIEVHEGRVWVESEGEGHGTTVCFTLHEKRFDHASRPLIPS